jgi:preprotein translocase subunit YajC
MYPFLAEEAAPSFFEGLSPLFLMVIIFVLMWFMFIRPQRKQEQIRRQMIANIKKNDRILTNGGLYGVVTNVKEQEDEITMRIDDTRDVKVRVNRNMIASVVTKKDAEKTD